MKILLTFFVLFFSSSVVADDISDFQIEGMSVGDSLLDYYSKDKILNSIVDYDYADDEFYQIYLEEKKFTTYEALQINLKTDDNNFIIYSIAGGLLYDKNIEACKIKKNEIVSQISKLLVTARKVDDGTYTSSGDPSGESKTTSVYFEIGEYDMGVNTIMIYCTDWSERIEKKFNWADNLRVSVDSKEYDYWINNKAYD